MNRPFTTVVLAMTADGKIANVNRQAARFSSPADKAHLERQISLVDGVLFGAETLRAYGTTLPISAPELLAARQQEHKPPQPVHIVCSASGKLDPQLGFFSQPIPRWLLTTPTGAKYWQGITEKLFQRVVVTEPTPLVKAKSINWVEVFSQFAELGLRKLAILGGGELVASLLGMNLIDEMWLTLCPVIFGGATAPTPVGGVGLSPQQLALLSVEQVEGEVFLHYRLQS
ncbi:MAG: RibD family protein [Gomphosphaeria aponina SAG 52.96 = DSM 107014]|uniref:RibD family protein n=1 Tax=Gomphosphaeria aponina SAG 52.96 = DSM 107014 TaxID=1521640 RepID=A0A941GYG6_9CHRO|nr:RibD family protein [Gomphosphaeria aponina SAG 52.96 = DSM 107014]